MSDKSPLERDIEIQEHYRIPAGVYIFIALLIAALAVSGFYIFELKRELSSAKKDLKAVQEEPQKVKNESLILVK